MDGGVCDNYPFDIVLDALADRRASVQTSRKLIYVEPDSRSQVEPHDHGEQPTVVETVKQALSTIPDQISLVDSLASLEEANGIATDLGELAEKLMNRMIADADQGALPFPFVILGTDSLSSRRRRDLYLRKGSSARRSAPSTNTEPASSIREMRRSRARLYITLAPSSRRARGRTTTSSVNLTRWR